MLHLCMYICMFSAMHYNLICAFVIYIGFIIIFYNYYFHLFFFFCFDSVLTITTTLHNYKKKT